MISLQAVGIAVQDHVGDLIALVRQGADDAAVATAFDRLIAIFNGLATRPDAAAVRDLIRHATAVLVAELGGLPLPPPPSWPRFVTLFGPEFVDGLGRAPPGVNTDPTEL